ncbi:MAG: NYN domain-containing protein [Coriobacteriia bacterium]
MTGTTPLTRVNVYIDGFNFYYAAFVGPNGGPGPYNSYKWLNLRSYVSAVLGNSFDVRTVRYFSTKVKPTKSDPDKHFRQDAYFRALTAHANVDVHSGGQFRVRQKLGKLVEPGYPLAVVHVEVREEKGADVSLASWLIYEACQGVFDAAVVVSDDSDLLEPVRMVQTYLGKDVFVIHLRKRRSSFANAAKYVYHGDKTHFFSLNQLPPIVVLPNGKTASKPRTW